MDASYGEAAVWTADIVQAELAGYAFVQWPSRGRHLLAPRLRKDGAMWVDPHGDVPVGPIGELYERAERWQ